MPKAAEDRKKIESVLQQLLLVVSGSLLQVKTQAGWTRTDHSRSVSRFYSSNPPVVRVVSGLAEGGDELAANTTIDMRVIEPMARWELAAVLAFPRASYPDSFTDPDYRPRFEALYNDCAYVVELDGKYDPKDAVRRRVAYRGQSALLLRQVDLLIALAPETGEFKAGGTLETLYAAVDFGLPAVFMDTLSGAVRFFPAGHVLSDLLAHSAPQRPEEVHKLLGDEVLWSVAGPDVREPEHESPAHAADEPSEDSLIETYFNDGFTPPQAGGKRRKTFLEGRWESFKQRFAPKKGKASAASPAPENPTDAYRRRASDLTGHFAGMYRGAFLRNYERAVWAVTLAFVSLLVFLGGVIFRSAIPEEIEISVLLALGFWKLAIVRRIAGTTRAGNREGWNERAVSYRYLAERLRAMAFLPSAGSYRPPAADSRRGARVARQSAVDWLFDAVVRQTPVRSHKASHVRPLADIDFRPVAALTQVREFWLEPQLEYHRKNAETMEKMFHHIERWIGVFSVLVILAVIADLAALIATLTHLWPEAHALTPLLLLPAAVLPAVIAGLNGVRFQTECRSLAERSEVMKKILKARIHEAEVLGGQIAKAKAAPTTDSGAWMPDVLRFLEAVAEDFAREAAEWSVLYDKEIRET